MQIDPELYPWLSAGALAWGILDCFFGYRVFKLTIAVLGGFAGALAGHALAALAQLDSTGALVAMVIGGLAGAGLAFLLYLAAVFFAGFCFGLTLGILLLAPFEHAVAVIGGTVLGLIGGLVAVKLQKALIILSTALLGAFRAVLALSYFTHATGWIYYYSQPAQIPALLEGHPWMFPAILVLAVIGVIAQAEGGGKKKKKSRDD